ncbi:MULTISPECIES: hypothetical protein [unclassified Burkholderia]|uniref:hypothetical protein n=1 Tax=unclassified Burkholderia TaxID=2613784 RepID=UPI002AB11460|nr:MULTISPECIES: hypothetical protein [unclassified Burkholderia]
MFVSDVDGCARSIPEIWRTTRPHRVRNMRTSRIAGCPADIATQATGVMTHNYRRKVMTLLIYLLGWIVFIAGVAWGLMTLHVSQHIIEIVAVILFGIAVITGATRARHRDRT